MRPTVKRIAAAITAVAAAILLIRHGGTVWDVTRQAAAVSTRLQLADAYRYVSSAAVSSVPTQKTVSSAPAASSLPLPEESEPLTPGEKSGSVIAKTISLSSAKAVNSHLHVTNKTGLNLNYKGYLSQGLPFTIKDSSQPQVLIVHTHATESYVRGKVTSTRTTKTEESVVRVGEEIAAVLNEHGIVTINDATLHDHPNYTGSYTRSAATIKKYLKKYPSIKVVIDGHRDSIATDSGKSVKPTAVVAGRKAAQVMILAGSETGDVTGYPHWEKNLRFCLLLQQTLETDYPDLCRPMVVKSCKYNFDLLPGSILMEIGTEANTLNEAVYSGRLIGNALAKLLAP